MKKYDGYSGTVEKFGKKWNWVRVVRHDPETDQPIEIFKVEPWYVFDHQEPRWRPGEEDALTLTVGVRGTEYTFPAKRVGCPSCDGGICRKLGFRPHGGICYCDGVDNTVIEFDEARMIDEQKIIYATYHLDRMMSFPW